MLSDHLEKLVSFKAVASAQSFRRAADDLNITQPTLTRAVQSLEAILDVKLFERSVRGVVLTSEGELLLRYAEEILVKAQDVERSIKKINDELAGIIPIGTYESLSTYLWPKFLTHLRRAIPNLQIKLSTSNRVNQIEELAKRKLKMVVDAEPTPHNDMISVPLYSDHFNFYASSKMKIEKNSPFIYVTSAYDEKRQTISQILDSRGVKHTLWYEVESFETAKAFALEGLGIAILPTNLARTSLRKLSRVSVSGFGEIGFGRHRIYATYNVESKSDNRVTRLVSELKKFSKIIEGPY